MNPALPTALDGLEQLFVQQAGALRSGDADALPALAQQLRQRLGELVRTTSRQPLPPGLRSRVLQLMHRARTNELALARRQAHVEAGLNALGAADPALQELQARSVYGAGGALATPAWRSRGFERA